MDDPDEPLDEIEPEGEDEHSAVRCFLRLVSV